MSSATRNDVASVGREMRSGGAYGASEGGHTPGSFLSQRQRQLDWYWKHYRCQGYDSAPFDWHGRKNMGNIERAAVVVGGEVPPGYYDAGGEQSPLEFRKPLAPHYLGKVIVDRFTSMLFSSSRHPLVTCDDPATQDWLEGFVDATRLWAQMIQVRQFGGATGSAGLGYKFVDGAPVIEVFDPRWCTPEFEDRSTLKVSRLEVLYQYDDEVRDEDGAWMPATFWFRRVIDDTTDKTWPKVLVQDSAPNWDEERCDETMHGLPHCPVVWLQNLPVLDEIDGDPDCFGAYDLIGRIDTLASQADRSTVANMDPTVAIASNAEFDAIKKGTGSALQVGAGETVTYLEMSGTGVTKALELMAAFTANVQTLTRCYLERNDGGPARTASEVEHNYSAMIDQANILREQYGEKGVKRLLALVLEAARTLGTPRIEETEDGSSEVVQTSIRLPKKKIVGEDGTATYNARQLGEGSQIDLSWPEYFSPSQDLVVKRVEAAGKAREYGLIDREHAVRYVQKEFAIDNLKSILASIEKEQKDITGNGEPPGAAPAPARGAR